MKYNNRFVVYLDDETASFVVKYRMKNNLRSESEAIRIIIKEFMKENIGKIEN